MKRKKWTALLLAGVMVLSLFGCASNGDPDASGSGNVQTESPSAGDEATDGKIVITD